MRQLDIYKEVTSRIVEALQKGVGPWIKPWAAEPGPHRNALTGRPYRGVNVLLLNLACSEKGFSSTLWLTFEEVKKLGGSIRKGEKGTRIILWKFIEVPELDQDGDPILDPETGEPVTRRVPFARLFVVFNLEQTRNVRLPRKVRERFKPSALGEALLKLPEIRWGTKAVYYPMEDLIELPPKESFRSSGDFYATAFHELIHWTGHPDRLNRDLSGRFGDRKYAMEELVAEMGAAFLSAHAGFSIRKLQHPEYINEWLSILESDRTFRSIFTAARMAQEACDWLLGKIGRI